MKVTLKKAHVLSQGLLAAARERTPETTISVSALDPALVDHEATAGRFDADVVGERIGKAVEAAVATLDRATAAIRTAYAIREKAAQERARAGVTELLARKVATEVQLATLGAATEAVADPVFRRAVPKVRAERSTQVLAQEAANKLAFVIQSMGKVGANVTSDAVAVDLRGALAERTEARVKELKRTLSEIADALTAVNFSTTVDLSADEVEILRLEGLLD